MNHLRLLAAGVAATTSLLLCAPVAVAAPDTAAAQSAAGYLVSHLVDGTHLTSELGNESTTAEAVLALIAAGRAEDAQSIEAMTGYLEQNAASYAGSAPESAAKLVLVAVAAGRDPAAFGGQDLLSAVKAGIGPDGSFGSFPGPYASGIGVVALATAGEEIPQTMIDWLLAAAASDGGWGYDSSQPSDPDSTGMALLALAAVAEPSAQVSDAIAAGIEWALANRHADGSWEGFAPVNSTAVLGSALQELGFDQPEAVAYLVSQQQPDGGLVTGADEATSSDLYATAQGTLLLAGTSYLNLTPAATATPLDPGLRTALWSLVGLIAAGIAVVIVREHRRL